MAVVAIDLISTSITSAVISMAGKVMNKEVIPIENIGGIEVSQLIQKQIKKLLVTYQNDPIQIKCIGISVPGICNSKTGNIWAPNIQGWEDYPLLQDLNTLLKGKNVRVRIDNNRTCSILGEHWLGAAKGCKNAIFLSVGKGIGAGILIDGRILHGFTDAVGAVGWYALLRPYKEYYKEKGSLEYYASGNGILNHAREMISKTDNYSGVLLKKDLKHLTIIELVEAYKQKDSISIKVFKESIEFWGMAVANLISSFNPEIMIFGGNVFGPALLFVEEIKSEAKKWAQPLSINKVKFLPSQLGANAGLFGAGHLAIGKF
ncbi:MAG: ROK family protein [Ignavibacteriales bacterium]|nr:ROK family protein [Ignavibacteriales bacterium]